MKKKRTFQGSKDDSAIVLENVFPESDLVISAPFEFEGTRSGVFVEGDPAHVETVFEHSKKLVNLYFEERFFGRWIGITPPEEDLARIIFHYESLQEIDKLQLLSFILPKHLAKFCDLCLSTFSHFLVRVEGKVIQSGTIVLPDFPMKGQLLLPYEEKKKIIFQ